jgi:hypothetical protein
LAGGPLSSQSAGWHTFVCAHPTEAAAPFAVFRKVRIPGAGVVGIRVERKPSADVAILLRSAKKKDYFAAGA